MWKKQVQTRVDLWRQGEIDNLKVFAVILTRDDSGLTESRSIFWRQNKKNCVAHWLVVHDDRKEVSIKPSQMSRMRTECMAVLFPEVRNIGREKSFQGEDYSAFRRIRSQPHSIFRGRWLGYSECKAFSWDTLAPHSSSCHHS